MRMAGLEMALGSTGTRQEAVSRGLQRTDYVLIVGTVIAPIDGLGLVGGGSLGEWLVIVWSLATAVRHAREMRLTFYALIWLLWFTVLIAGTVLGVNKESSGTIVAGLVPWLAIVLVATVVYSAMMARPIGDAWLVLKRIGVIGASVYAIVYLVSLLSPTIAGLSLYYGGVRFTAGASNPHQLATLLAPVIFINISAATTDRSLARKGLHIGLAIGVLAAALATESSTLTVALLLTAVIGGAVYAIRLESTTSARAGWAALLAGATVGAALLWFDEILSKGGRFIEADSNGTERLEIFASIGETWLESPLVGLGPGVHAFGGTIEFHNSYLEIVAMSGIAGGLLLVLYLGRVLIRLAPYPSLFVVALPLFLYGLGGFSFRRLPFWVILMLLAAASDQLRLSRPTTFELESTAANWVAKADC